MGCSDREHNKLLNRTKLWYSVQERNYLVSAQFDRYMSKINPFKDKI